MVLNYNSDSQFQATLCNKVYTKGARKVSGLFHAPVIPHAATNTYYT